MRIKPLPPPPEDLEAVRAAQRAVPLVPAPEETCTRRVMAALGVDRDEAGRWLAVLRAASLVRRSTRGFARVRREPTRSTLVDAFRDGVFGTEEVIAVLRDAGDPLPADAVFDRFADHVPPWERHRDPGWRTRWADRTDRLLGWLHRLQLVERTNGRFRLATSRG